MHHGITLRIVALGCALLVSSCAGPEIMLPDPLPEEAETWPEPVGAVILNRLNQTSENELLDVALTLFDPGIPEDAATHSKKGIFPRIREAESRYMPALLRQTLQDSNAWGVVRVVPEADATSELLVHGTIQHSDGLHLVIHVTVEDATGRLWMERVYHDESRRSDYPVALAGDPFQDLYRAVANDLLGIRKQLLAKELDAIRETGRLRYAKTLAPEAFAGYLSSDDAGRYQLLRLPSAQDPMLQRIQKVRDQEYQFIDTVDEQYAALLEEMAPTYHLWREYGREQALFREEYQRRVAGRDTDGRKGSFSAMQQSYNAYKWTKIHEQDLDELALGFNNEVAPTVMEVQGEVFRLSGTLGSQYDEWRVILRRIFELETGLPVSN